MRSKLVIAVDGLDGSGKSTFARRLASVLGDAGVTAVQFHVDDFRQPVAWTTPEREADQYYEAYYDLGHCDRCLQAFVEGAAEISIPTYDIALERVVGSRPLALADATVAIVEGVFPLRLPHVASGTLIYLDTREAELRRRIIARDLKKGRTVDEIVRRIDRRYFPSQQRYLRELASRDRANIIIDNEDPLAPRIVRRDLERVPAVVRDAIERIVVA